MTCRTLEDAIVELARGHDVGRGTAAAIESHVDHCAACAIKLARERQVSAGLRALAASTAGEAPSAMLERRLQEAFAAHAIRPARRWWIPAAAAAAAAVGIWGWQAMRVAPSGRGTVVGIESRATAPVQSATPAPAPTAASGSPATGRTPPPAVRRSTTARRNPGGRAGAGDTGFVALPAAAGLPDFESGVILRMEMPPASLPAYGIDIVADTKSPVVADFLIGQDGKARAIRLVTRATTRAGAEQ